MSEAKGARAAIAISSASLGPAPERYATAGPSSPSSTTAHSCARSARLVLEAMSPSTSSRYSDEVIDREISASASSSATRRWERSYSLAFSMACPTCPAMADRSATSLSANSRGLRVRTLSAPARWSRAITGTARIDSYSSSGRLGNARKRGSRWAWLAIMIGCRSSAATPVIPSPGRMRGRCAGSSKRVPCVARSSSMPDASS